MRIRLLSDLHLEFHADGGTEFISKLPNENVDVLVLAGDIASLNIFDALKLFCRRFKQVIFVAGNHEFYSSSPSFTYAKLAVARATLKNLCWLECSSVTIDNVVFRGATLWFPPPPKDAFKRGMNDFNCIDDFEPWVYERNALAKHFFDRQLAEGDVVVTHHLPSRHSIDPKYDSSPLNCFFVSDVEAKIKERRPALWLHGHTHASCDYTLDTTRVVCNPHGYLGPSVDDRNPSFDPELTIEIH